MLLSKKISLNKPEAQEGSGHQAHQGLQNKYRHVFSPSPTALCLFAENRFKYGCKGKQNR